MSLPIRCPTCGRETSLPEFDPPAGVRCPRCDTVLGPARSVRGPLIVAIGAGLLLAVGAVGVVVWLAGRVGPAAAEADGGDPTDPDLYTTPDGATFRLKFPVRAAPVQLKVLGREVTGLAARDPSADTTFVAWVWVIPEDERWVKSDAELAIDYLRRSISWRGATQGGTVRQWNGRSVGEGEGAIPTGKKEWGLESFGDKAIVWTVVAGDRVYGLRVQGPGKGWLPGAKAFLDSLAFVSPPLPPPLTPPPPAPPPTDELRLVARIAPFFALDFAPGPTGPAVYALRPPSYDGRYQFPTGRLARYEYPSLRPAAEFALPALGSRLVIDAARGRAYTAAYTRPPKSLNAHEVVAPAGAGAIHAYDLGGAPAGGDEPPKLKPTKVIPLGGDVRHLGLSPDGKYLYYLAGGKAGRIDAASLAPAGELDLGPRAEIFCQDPAGRAVFAAGRGADPARPFGEVWEIDPQTWTVRRTFETPENPFDVDVGPDGRLYLTGVQGWVYLTALDPTAGGRRPPCRRIGGVDGGSCVRVTADGSRLYLGTNIALIGLDAGEVVRYGRRRQLGEVRSGQSVVANGRVIGLSRAGGRPFLSPDGKCLINRPGDVYWLTGAGPPPEVDPAAKP